MATKIKDIRIRQTTINQTWQMKKGPGDNPATIIQNGVPYNNYAVSGGTVFFVKYYYLQYTAQGGFVYEERNSDNKFYLSGFCLRENVTPTYLILGILEYQK